MLTLWPRRNKRPALPSGPNVKGEETTEKLRVARNITTNYCPYHSIPDRRREAWYLHVWSVDLLGSLHSIPLD